MAEAAGKAPPLPKPGAAKPAIHARPGPAAPPRKPLTFITPDCVDGSRIKALIVGQAGVGKTSLLRTIPENERVCTISVEGGLLSVNDMLRAGKINGVIIDDFKELDTVLDHLRTDWLDKFDWVFLDSISELSAKCLTHYYNLTPNDNRNLYNHYGEAMYSLTRRIKDLPKYNIICTCMLGTKTENDKTTFVPDVPGKMQTRLTGLFDELFYMEVQIGSDKTSKRVFKTNIGAFPAKDRSGKLAPTEPANLGHIRDKILNK
jgi:hypothetical protein